MKLLLMSVIGREDQEEDLRFVNMYFASLKKNVVPFFDTKVILITTWASKEKTLQRIKEYGLEDVIILKQFNHTSNEMEIPQESYKLMMDDSPYYRNLMRLNLLHDYARKYNFFDADWVFQVDTDIEFLENFSMCLNAINGLSVLHPRITISLAGDNYKQNIVYGGKKYTFKDAPRVNYFDVSTLSPKLHDIELQVENLDPRDYRSQLTKPRYIPEQTKIRNDFFGMTREVAEHIQINWVHMEFPYDLQVGELKEVWKEDWPELQITHAPGDSLGYDIYCGHLDVMWIHLLQFGQMMNHYYGGWGETAAKTNLNLAGDFIGMSFKVLNEKFADMKHIWENDYK